MTLPVRLGVPAHPAVGALDQIGEVVEIKRAHSPNSTGPDRTRGRHRAMTSLHPRSRSHTFRFVGNCRAPPGEPMPAPTAPSVRRLRSTARAMLPLLPEPESWLDVATGDADFPEAARTLFPYTAFDGVDPTPRVLHAQAVERLEEGHVGCLTDPQITSRLRGRYDVVSILNRPADPGELRAALTVLRPGGHLLVESPDDPRPALESQGCAIVATTRRSAHVPDRLTTRLTRTLPALCGAARTLDHTMALLVAGTRFARTYRVIARKAPSVPSAP
ncbi:methyltransferase domain-containing protein [Streptomyces sp. SID13726]|uniref:methyltransferase domain-containing protein n=1 Tax=Streptomyces sp. SID13726 TaxID=2706058 RepID=UPI0013B6BFB4|nr:methyltransferase domain-containing protein [Streptomyces sp. SID13726]NEB01743.1 class I SAM-dependent methyltransferase [Streptomyces sp. SID13726]